MKKNTEQEKISIIVPVYKVEKYLDKCINSIVNQTYKNLEIILVDDGSPDNCPQICDDWEKKDNRIIVIHKTNGGLSDARNFGIEKASGDYLMFVDSDDWLDKTICEVLFNLLKKHNADISMCQAQYVYENQNNEEQEEKANKNDDFNTLEKTYSGDDLLRLMINKEISLYMVAWAKLYKKEIFNTLQYDVGKIHEDEFIIHKIMAKIKRLSYTNKQLYFYLQREGSIVKTKTEKSYTDSLEAFQNRLSFLFTTNLPKQEILTWITDTLKMSYIQAHITKISKQIQKEYLATYRKYYKELEKKNLKNTAFNLFPNLFSFLHKIKNKSSH